MGLASLVEAKGGDLVRKNMHEESCIETESEEVLEGE